MGFEVPLNLINGSEVLLNAVKSLELLAKISINLFQIWLLMDSMAAVFKEPF